ncbi:hypothetical protein AAC387_Pa03g1566 [Persea americana]
MAIITTTVSYHRELAVFANVFGITAIILMLVWLLHFRGGIDLDSDDPNLIFNVHPFLMFCGYIFIAGQAIMVYRTVMVQKKVQKFIHMVLHLIAITLGIIGIYAVFKFHNASGIANMYSLHSWVGIVTFCLYGLQWLFGFLYFWFPGAAAINRERARPLHKFAGLFIFLMAICTAMMGLVEKFFFLKLQVGTEAHLTNFIGLFVILFGFSACFSVII